MTASSVVTETEGSVNAHDLWRVLCRAIRPTLSPALYRACFAGTRGVELHDHILIVQTPTATAREQMRQRFGPVMEGMAPRVVRLPLKLHFVLAPPLVLPQPLALASSMTPVIEAGSPTMPRFVAKNHLPLERGPAVATLPFTALNPRYVFDTFVAGDSNRLAYAAARDIAETPGTRYNPLFLYGDVGLGKTHLLMAIGHVARHHGLRVGYLTAESFANEMVLAIQHNRPEAFRAAYRAVDVLLVDDIQFIGGRERTEEEFFHTFNDLHIAGKQIVLTSDRPPRSIPTLHDRLRSRFEWGLMADIAAPDYEHRQAIVAAKAAKLAVHIPDAVLEFIGRPEGVSVRALEGALNRVVMAAETDGVKVTLALAAAALGDYLGEHYRTELEPELVIDLVAKYYQLDHADLVGKSRNRVHAWPRQVAMYLMRETTPASLSVIGTALGGRDHTTIMHGCDQVAEIIKRDELARQAIETLRTQIRAQA